MDQNTPARSIKGMDLYKNSSAMSDVIEKIPLGSVKTVLDIRYGLGGWAERVSERFPEATIKGYEHDPETAAKAWKNDRVELIVGRFEGVHQADLLLADFNTVTHLKRDVLDEALSLVDSDWIVFTDVACGKFHINWRSYGLQSMSLMEYWTGYNAPGLVLVRWAKYHHAASTALFQRKNPANREG